MISLIIKALGLLLVALRLEGAMRSDTWNVTVSIGGAHLGTWDWREGGEIDSNELTYKPGGMGDPVSLGGTKNVGNLTIRRLYRLGRDHVRSQYFINQVGKGSAVVVAQPLDHDGNAWGKPLVWKGTLKRITFPTHDSTSSDAAMLEAEITVEGFPTGMAA